MNYELRFKNIKSKRRVLQDLLLMIRYSNRGFTLLELIVVIGVLAVVAVTIMSILEPFVQFEKANDARRKSDLNQIQKVLEQYYQDNGRYPASNASYKIVRLDGSAVIRTSPAWSPYMNVVPFDPKITQDYVYYSTANGQTYYIYANLERGAKDPQTCNNGNPCTSLNGNGISLYQCAPPDKACNYGVSSPNVSP